MESRITIFGDSITWGACDTEYGGWAARLRRYVEVNISDEIEVYNMGVSGDTTKDLLARFDAECVARNRHPQTIIFAIGINDSRYLETKNNLETPLEKFEVNLMELIKKAKKCSDKIIFVGLTKVDELKTTPYPWRPDRDYTNENVILYNSAIEEICHERGLPFISMLDAIEMDDLEDGLHPNSKGHEKMFLRVKEFLLSKNILV
jgi:lysophospholipase L1-like esterase